MFISVHHAKQAMGSEMAAMICPRALRGRGGLKRGIVGVALRGAAKEAGATASLN
jgi:hypothetical protein